MVVKTPTTTAMPGLKADEGFSTPSEPGGGRGGGGVSLVSLVSAYATVLQGRSRRMVVIMRKEKNARLKEEEEAAETERAMWEWWCLCGSIKRESSRVEEEGEEAGC